MKIRFILLVILVFGLYLIVSFSRDIWHLGKKGEEINKVNLRLEELKVKNQELENRLQEVQSSVFLEKEAREKLGLAREGETILILPENLKEQISLNQPKGSEDQRMSNWQKWRKLFF